MNDLEDRLSRLLPTGAEHRADSRSDLRRGRRARHERGARRVATGGLVCLGLGAAVVVGAQSRGHDGAPSTTSPTPGPDPSSATPGRGDGNAHHRHTPRNHRPPVKFDHLRLVAYHGEQEPGFTVDYVPDGFVLEGADRAVLAVARPDDHSDIASFEDKLVVTVTTKSNVYRGHGDRDVVINGHAGWVGAEDDTSEPHLFFQLDDGRWVFVQSWATLGLTDDQLVKFADGLTVRSNAETVY